MRRGRGTVAQLFETKLHCLLDVLKRFVMRTALADASGQAWHFGNPAAVFASVDQDLAHAFIPLMAYSIILIIGMNLTLSSAAGEYSCIESRGSDLLRKLREEMGRHTRESGLVGAPG